MSDRITGLFEPIHRILIALLAVLITYSSTSIKVLTSWWEQSHSNLGLAITPLCLYLFYRDTRNQETDYSFYWPVTLLIAFSSLTLTSAKLVNVDAVEQSAFLIIILLIPVCFFGPGFLKKHRFIFAYSLLAFPIWTYLTPLAQALTTNAVSFLLSLTSLPIYRSGFSLELPVGTFIVEEGCSGIRYLMAAIATSALYLHLSKGSYLTKYILFFTLILFSIIGNWIRILFVIWIATQFGFDHPAVEDHSSIGWVIFVIALGIWFFISGRYLIALPLVVENNSQAIHNETHTPLNYRIICYLAIAIFLFPGLSAWLSSIPSKLQPNLVLGSFGNDWSELADEEYQANFPGASEQKTLSRKSPENWIYIAAYHQQSQGAELVNENNTTYDPQTWHKIDQNYGIYSQNTEALPYRELLIRNHSGEMRLIWQWYEYGFARTNNALQAKIYGLYGLLRGAPSAAQIAIIAPVKGSKTLARESISTIISNNFDSFGNILDGSDNAQKQ